MSENLTNIPETPQAQNKWPKIRILKWISNSILVVALIILIGAIIIWGFILKDMYTTMKDTCDDIVMPSDMQEMSLSTAIKLTQDNYNWTYDDYWDALYKQMYQIQLENTDYTAHHKLRLYATDYNIAYMQFDVVTKLFKQGDIAQGTITTIAYGYADTIEERESLAKVIPIYLQKEDGAQTLYLQIAGKWVKTTLPEDKECLINLTPIKVLDLVKDIGHSSPMGTYGSELEFDANKFIYGPYKYILPDGCPDAMTWPGSVFTHNDKSMWMVTKYGIQYTLDYNGLLNYATEQNDIVLPYLMNNAYITSGMVNSSYAPYSEEDPDVIIPEEVIAATEITQEDLNTLMNEVIIYFEQEIAYAKEHHENGN